MRRRNRHRYILNLFCFGLLAIALYLNFFKKEKTESIAQPGKESLTQPATQTNGASKTMSVNATAPAFVLK